MKKWGFFFSCLVLCCLAVSCATRTEYETVEVKVPVPVEIDIKDIVDPVLQQRPDNSLLKIHTTEPLRLIQQLENGATYFYAWEMWQNYAESLEQTIDVIEKRLLVEK